MAFLLTFTALGEGGKELEGLRKDGGLRPMVEQETHWELGSSEEVSMSTFEQRALPR